MTTIAVIGAGDVGGATAHALAASDVVSRVLIVDPAAGVAAGKALDIQQTGPIAGFHATLQGTDDLSRVVGCAAWVVADPFGDAAARFTDDDRIALLSRLHRMSAGVPMVMASPSPAGAIELAVHELGLDRRQIVGSSVEAYASSVRAMVALEVGCSPGEVSLSVLGRPPHGLVVLWSDATIGGYPLTARVDSGQMNRIEARIERLWPPGPYTLGRAAAGVTAAIVGSSRRFHLVVAILDGAFGIRHGVGVIPAMLGPSGIAHTWTPPLAPGERARLLSALGDGLPARR